MDIQKIACEILHVEDIALTRKQADYLKAEISNHFSDIDTEKIWGDAVLRLQTMYDDHENLPKGVKKHTDGFIFPAAAIYLAIKEYDKEKAFDIMQKVMHTHILFRFSQSSQTYFAPVKTSKETYSHIESEYKTSKASKVLKIPDSRANIWDIRAQTSHPAVDCSPVGL